jgi:hypothetical protein
LLSSWKDKSLGEITQFEKLKEAWFLLTFYSILTEIKAYSAVSAS